MVSNRVFRALCFVAAGIILVLSLLPDLPDSPVEFRAADKIEHFVAYLGLGLLVALADWAGSARRNYLLALGVALVFGGAIEVLQQFTGRDPELLDLLADVVGAAAGGAVAGLLRLRLKARPGGNPPPEARRPRSKE